MSDNAYMGKLAAIIRDARKRHGMSQRELADALGVSRSAVNQWESESTVPDRDRLPEIARILNLNANDLLGSLGDADAVTSRGFEAGRLTPNVSFLDRDKPPQLPSSWPRDVPVYGTVSGGPGGLQMNDGQQVDWVRRPPRYEGRKGLFAAFVEDMSMSPRYEPGELVYIDALRKPQNNDYVVIETQTGPNEERRAIIKRLLSQSGSKIRVCQFNPAREFEIPREHIIHLYRVIPFSELLGV